MHVHWKKFREGGGGGALFFSLSLSSPDRLRSYPWFYDVNSASKRVPLGLQWNKRAAAVFDVNQWKMRLTCIHRHGLEDLVKPSKSSVATNFTRSTFNRVGLFFFNVLFFLFLFRLAAYFSTSSSTSVTSPSFYLCAPWNGGSQGARGHFHLRFNVGPFVSNFLLPATGANLRGSLLNNSLFAPLHFSLPKTQPSSALRIM